MNTYSKRQFNRSESAIRLNMLAVTAVVAFFASIASVMAGSANDGFGRENYRAELRYEREKERKIAMAEAETANNAINENEARTGNRNNNTTGNITNGNTNTGNTANRQTNESTGTIINTTTTLTR